MQHAQHNVGFQYNIKEGVLNELEYIRLSAQSQAQPALNKWKYICMYIFQYINEPFDTCIKVFFSETRKLELREAESSAQVHTTSKHHIQDTNPGLTSTKTCAPSYYLVLFKVMMAFQGIKNVNGIKKKRRSKIPLELGANWVCPGLR